jgi:hypothetical protein
MSATSSTSASTTDDTDQTRGQSLKSRVLAHKQALEDTLAALSPTDRARRDVEAALSQVHGLLTGDLDHIPHVVAAELSRWLEATKYVDIPART